MNENIDKLILGKRSSFVKSRLSRLPRTDEVWEADIRPMSVSGWDARRHGELWLGMVLTRLEDFRLALESYYEVPPGVLDDAVELHAGCQEGEVVLMTHQQAYFLVSGLIFGLVALVHALRLVFRWPISLRSQEIPVWLSGLGLVAAAVMCLWAFWLLV